MSVVRGERELEAIADPLPGGGWTIRSPRVGILRGLPRPGGHRGAGEPIGRLMVLDRTEVVILPPGVDGLVADLSVPGRAAAVEYGQPLFRLAPAGSMALPRASAAGRESAGGDLPEGCHGVVSPIDGVFYRRPSPGADPFVEVGQTVETGRTLGLIEAMKSFNAVLYGGPALPPRAVIVEARASDAAEVPQGAILFVVRGA